MYSAVGGDCQILLSVQFMTKADVAEMLTGIRVGY